MGDNERWIRRCGRVDSTLYIYKYLFHPLSAAAAKCAGVKKDYREKYRIPARALAARSEEGNRHPAQPEKCTHNSARGSYMQMNG